MSKNMLIKSILASSLSAFAFVIFALPSSAAAFTLGVAPSSIIQYSTGNSLTVTGGGTSWPVGATTTLFTLSGGTGASITSQTVNSTTSATILVNAGSAAGTLTLTDTSTASTTSITVTADVTPPTITITSPATGSSLFGSATFTSTSSDNVAVTGIQFVLDSSTNVGVSGSSSPYSVSLDTTPLTNGGHSIVAVARDQAGNIATSSAVAFTVINGCSTTYSRVGNLAYTTKCGVTTVSQITPVLLSTASGSGSSTTTQSATVSSSTSSTTPVTVQAPTSSCPIGFLCVLNVGTGAQTTASGSAVSASGTSKYVFNADLGLNSTGNDAKLLQVYLNTHGFAVSVTGAGSSGQETARFGAKTQAALAKFQKANGIAPATGYFGPITRAYVNAH